MSFASPQDAQAAGIVTIYQEFTLAPDMTIAENVFIGREPRLAPLHQPQASSKTRRQRAAPSASASTAAPRALVRDLSVAEQQMVEIARALSMKSRLIVMDEPTSALSRAEVREAVRDHPRRSSARASRTIFVTHRLEEVFEICDRYTVLRDGRHVGAGAVAETTIDGIIRLMVGRELGLLAPRETSFATRRGGARGRRTSRAAARAPMPSAIELHDVSLEVRKGEILGIAGLVGAGRTETARAIFGADAFDSGTRAVDGRPVQHRLAARRHRARHRPGAGGPQAAGAVPGARHPHQPFDRRA